jgi:hypothetical protein
MMVAIDDLYEPLARQLSRYGLIESLAIIHAYVQNLQNQTQIPPQIELNAEVAAKHGREKGYYEWELELLSRELLAYGNMHGLYSLSRWNEFSTTINTLKALENNISERTGDLLGRNIFLELARIAHRQFPWQTSPNSRTLTRYYKIFSSPALDTLIQRTVGLTTRELYTIGLAMTGLFLEGYSSSYPVDFAPLGIRQEAGQAFIRHFARPLSTLIQLAKVSETHSEDFAYSYNPLRQYPLVHVFLNGTHRVMCPIPTYLFHRFTSGIFFELCGERGFGDDYGHAFEAYIGDVLRAAFAGRQVTITPEASYHVGRNRKDTTDWILSDGSAHLFVECKAKRLKLASKVALADTATLHADLDTMADAIVQTYKGIKDAEAGLHPNWAPDGKPIYPIIVTLEEWYLFSDPLTSFVETRVKEKLTAAGLDPALADQRPYTVASCEDFEMLMRIIARHDSQTVMSTRFYEGKRHWNTHAYLLEAYRADVQELHGGLFREEMDEIHPAIRNPVPPGGLRN